MKYISSLGTPADYANFATTTLYPAGAVNINNASTAAALYPADSTFVPKYFHTNSTNAATKLYVTVACERIGNAAASAVYARPVIAQPGDTIVNATGTLVGTYALTFSS